MSEERTKLRCVEIRLRKAVVFVDDKKDIEPRTIHVLEWLNINLGVYDSIGVQPINTVIETLSGWLSSMILTAHPMKDEFKLTLDEAKHVVARYTNKVMNQSLYYVDYEGRPIKVLP